MAIAAAAPGGRHVRSVPGLNGAAAREAAAAGYAALVEQLKQLDPAEWDAQTDCDRWNVHDVVAHIVGWMEMLRSFKETRHIVRSGWRRRKELGNILDAGNEQQVEDRRNLSPEELIARIEGLAPGLVRFRARGGAIGRGIPIYDPVVVGASNLGFMLNVIFTRDILMHRIDIARATGRGFELEDADRPVMADVIKDWAKRSKADAIVSLEGLGTYIAGTGVGVRISGSVADFCRVMTKRAEPSVMSVDGDTAAALRWLKIRAPF